MSNETTTFDLLDALEARLRAGGGCSAVSGDAMPPETLRGEMHKASVSAGELCKVLGVARGQIEAWLQGVDPAPRWVQPCLRVMALLPESARRSLLYPPGRHLTPGPNRNHPFSRIEDL